MKKFFAFLVALAFCVTANAAFEQFDFEDDNQKSRYSELTKQLRCLVCQNQTIHDSNASLASDLRIVVHDMIKSGSSDDEIIEFMVERYGDFVLYRPPFRISTLALWVSPFLLMALALFVFWRLAKK